MCVCMCVFCIRRQPGVSQRKKGQHSYKCLMFALYIAAAHTGMWEIAFLQNEEMIFCKTPQHHAKEGDYRSSVWLGSSLLTAPTHTESCSFSLSLSLCLSPHSSLPFVPSYSSISILVPVAQYPDLPHSLLDGSPVSV